MFLRAISILSSYSSANGYISARQNDHQGGLTRVDKWLFLELSDTKKNWEQRKKKGKKMREKIPLKKNQMVRLVTAGGSGFRKEDQTLGMRGKLIYLGVGCQKW